LDFKGRKRMPIPPRHYTALFFLDEATALAAGHRPCAECQRARFHDFRGHWTTANPERVTHQRSFAATLDATLHDERISDHRYQRDKVKLTYCEHLDRLPDGAFVALAAHATPYLVLGDALLPWSFAGYGQPLARSAGTVQVLTPRSVIRALAHGYQPIIHASAHAHR
jgi:hypothetical protein